MPLDNLYFFTGENSYALTKELRRWRQAFASKHGQENLHVLQGKSAMYSEILDAVAVLPFIAEKRLVIVEGIPKIEKDDFADLLRGIHPQTVVAFVESKPDKRLSVVKELEKQAQVKSFPSLSDAELRSWVLAELASLGASIRPTALSTLLSCVGSDQWTLQTELQKLSIAVGGSTIEPSHVELHCIPSGSQVVWRLTDLIGSGRANEALIFLRHRLERGEDPYGLWVILLSMIKNLTLVFAALQEGAREERGIATATGLHFMSVRGVLPLAKSMTMQRIRQLVDGASQADIALKSGGYHYSSEKPHELIALTERLILMTGA